ncbi:hypothetical protein [Maridesulfovibrio sp.]|uniref:hypothetical protein n=1 Tax=Maridesulfovibrio sp. TaxID=2795000 RepID=UPI002A189DBF|nr:hypothetical protein [Maridesulfovibrio sp.]
MFKKIILIGLLLICTGCLADSKKAFNDFVDQVTTPAEQTSVTYYTTGNTPVYPSETATNQINTILIGQEVSVFELGKNRVRINEGWVDLDFLEKERTYFQLTVEKPTGAAVKILNIKPKYHDGIWLKEGKYHVAIYPKGKSAIKGWISLDKDRRLTPDSLKEPVKYGVTVKTPESAVVKILNIGPKYHDGIQLSPGKYHVAVYRENKIIYDKWISLKEDTVIDISGMEEGSPVQVASRTKSAPEKQTKQAAAATGKDTGTKATNMVDPKKDAGGKNDAKLYASNSGVMTDASSSPSAKKETKKETAEEKVTAPPKKEPAKPAAKKTQAPKETDSRWTKLVSKAENLQPELPLPKVNRHKYVEKY